MTQENGNYDGKLHNMRPEDYGAKLTTLDEHLDRLNSPDVLKAAADISTFHWTNVIDQSKKEIEFVAIPFRYDESKVKNATAHLLHSYLNSGDRYFGFKLGGTYLSIKEILDSLAKEWQENEEISFSAENRKSTRILLSRNMPFLYNGKFVRAPEGNGFSRLYHSSHRLPIKQTPTLQEILYLKAISSD